MALAILLAGSVVRWAFLLLIDEAHFIASTSGIRVAMVTSVDHMGVNTEPSTRRLNGPTIWSAITTDLRLPCGGATPRHKSISETFCDAAVVTFF